MSEQTIPPQPSAPPPEKPVDTFTEDWASRLIPDSPSEPRETVDASPAAEPSVSGTPAPSAPAPSGTPSPSVSPSATAAEKRLLRLKEDGQESDLDLDEHWGDPEKRKTLTAWLQQGRMHDKVVGRRVESAQAETTRFFTENLERLGYRAALDDNNNLVLIPKNGSPNTHGGQVPGSASGTQAPPPEPTKDADQILREMEALDAKVADGDVTAIAEQAKLNRELLKIQRAEANQLRAWKENAEKMRQAQEQQARTATLVSAVEKFRSDNAAEFDGLSDRQYATLVSGCAQQSGGNPEKMFELLRDYASAVKAQRAKWQTSQPVTPSNGNGTQARPSAAPAPPVHGGFSSPQSSAPSKPTSTFERGWADKLIP